MNRLIDTNLLDRDRDSMHFSSQTVNVLRYTALGSGAAYGFYYQGSLASRFKAQQAQVEWKQKEALINEAKAEWAKTYSIKISRDFVTDPDDSRFDLEKFLFYLAAQDNVSA